MKGRTAMAEVVSPPTDFVPYEIVAFVDDVAVALVVDDVAVTLAIDAPPAQPVYVTSAAYYGPGWAP